MLLSVNVMSCPVQCIDVFPIPNFVFVIHSPSDPNPSPSVPNLIFPVQKYRKSSI